MAVQRLFELYDELAFADRIIVDDQDMRGARIERFLYSLVRTLDISFIGRVYDDRRFRQSLAHLLDRTVPGTVVHDHQADIVVPARKDRPSTLNGVVRTIPVYGNGERFDPWGHAGGMVS